MLEGSVYMDFVPGHPRGGRRPTLSVFSKDGLRSLSLFEERE